MPRTNISIADNIADDLSVQAMKKNKTLYAFANESLEAVISICKLSGEPGEVVPSWKMGRMLKDIDAVPLPGDLVEKLIKKLYAADKAWLLKTWFDEGARTGHYLQMGYSDISKLSQAAIEFQGLLPLKRIEIRSVEDQEARGNLMLRAIGLGLSAESTACAEQFIRGILDSYSWSAKAGKLSEGILELELVKERRQQ